MFIFLAFLIVVFFAVGFNDEASYVKNDTEKTLQNSGFSVPASSREGFYPRFICQRAVADRLGYPELGRFPGPQSPDYVAKATVTETGWYVVSYVDYYDDDSAGMKREAYRCTVALNGTVSIAFY